MAAKSNNSGPNYLLVAGLGVAGAAAGAGAAHFGLHLGQMETGIAGVVGFLVLAGAGLLKSTAQDTKKLAAQVLVKKNVDAAYEAQSLGRLDQAEKLLLEALDKGKPLGDADLNNLAAIHSLGNLYRLQNKLDKAEEKYRQAISLYETLGKTQDINCAYCLRDCALVLEARNQIEASLEMARRAVSIMEGQASTREIAEVMSIMARNTRASGHFQQAIDTYKRVKEMQLQQGGESSPGVIETVVTLARCYRALNQLPEALEHYKDALVRINKSDRPQRLWEAEALLEMAEVRLAQDAPKDVEPITIGALKVMQGYAGPKERLLVRMAAAVKEAREKLGQPFLETEFLQLFTQNRDQVRDIFREKPDLAKQKDRTGWSPLQWTLFLGWDDLMRWLSRNGAPLDGYEATVMSPIHVAAAWSKGSTITFLAEAGVTLDVVGPNGWSPVHYAAYHGRQDCLDQLLARGCEASRTDQSGRTGLHYAAEQGHNDIVALLLGKGLDKNASDAKFGRTPLHLAAQAGYGAVVRTLMMNGADENAADKQGKTPIQLAEESGYRGLVAAMKHFKSAMES